MSHHLPAAIVIAIQHAIGAKVEISPLAGGTNQHTYLAQQHQNRWVVHAEPAPATTLQRAVAAQALAYSHGVRVPQTLAYQLSDTDAGEWFWSLESYTHGTAFAGAFLNSAAAVVATRDVAEQLQRLHAIAVDAFGDRPPRPYPVYPTATAWVQNKQRRVAAALSLIGGSAAMVDQVEQIYMQLAGLYAESARLAKGDCAGANLLVDRTHHVTFIDWEWAQGLDPAADIAYWFHFTPHPALHTILLDAYQPADRARFQQRVFAYRVLHAIELIHVYAEHEDAFGAAQSVAGLRSEAKTLQGLLSVSKHIF